MNRAETKGELESLRHSVERGPPFGSKSWCDELTSDWGWKQPFDLRGVPGSQPCHAGDFKELSEPKYDSRPLFSFNKSYPPLTALQPTSGSATVRVERQREDWRIVLDGEDVAVVPFCHPTTLPEIRLRVDKGTAQFADLFFEVLAAKQ